MVERCVFLVSILRPSNRVIYVWIAASSVETRELGDVWTSVDSSPVKHCRLRPPSLVQSSSFLLSLVSCCCMPCCFPFACSCVFACVLPLPSLFLFDYCFIGFSPKSGGWPEELPLSLSLFGRVRLGLCHVCGHFAVLLGFGLALIRCRLPLFSALQSLRTSHLPMLLTSFLARLGWCFGVVLAIVVLFLVLLVVAWSWVLLGQ